MCRSRQLRKRSPEEREDETRCAPECDSEEAAPRATRTGRQLDVSHKACPEGDKSGDERSKDKGKAGRQEGASHAGYQATRGGRHEDVSCGAFPRSELKKKRQGATCRTTTEKRGSQDVK